MKMKYLKKIILCGAGLGLFLFLLLFFVTTKQIGAGVDNICDTAKSRYEGTCVDALMKYLDDEQNSFDTRNSAVWALGQLGDPKALHSLEKYYDAGFKSKKCKRSETLCQYELYKAVKLLNGGLNISAFVWRNDGYFSDSNTESQYQ